MSKWFSILLLLVSITSVQVGASFAKRLFPTLGTRAVCFIRIAVASIVLVSIWRAWRFRPTKQQFKQIAMYGVALGVMNLTYYLSIERIPIGLAVALEFIGPLAVALYFSRKPLDFLWAFLALIGILLILPMTRDAHAINTVGVIFALTAGAAWACYVVLGKKASSIDQAGMSTTLGMVIALAAVSPFCLPVLDAAPLAQPWILVMAIGVGVLSSALPYSLEMVVLKSIPPKNFSILQSLSPVVAALASFVILGEELSPSQIFAIGCILVASVGSALLVKPSTPPPIEV